MNNEMNETQQLSELLRNLPAPQRLDAVRRQKIFAALPPEEQCGDTGAVAESPNRQLPALCHNARHAAAVSQRGTNRFFFPKLRAVAAVLVGVAALSMFCVGVFNGSQALKSSVTQAALKRELKGGESYDLDGRIIAMAHEIEEREEALRNDPIFGTTVPVGAFMPAEERVGAFRSGAILNSPLPPPPVNAPMSAEDVSGKLARDVQNEISRRSNVSGDAEIAKFKERANTPLSPKPAAMNTVDELKSPVVMRGMSASRNSGVESKKLADEVAASTTPGYISGDVVVELDGEPVGGSGFAIGGGTFRAPATPASSLGIVDGKENEALADGGGDAALSAGVSMLAGRTVGDAAAQPESGKKDSGNLYYAAPVAESASPAPPPPETEPRPQHIESALCSVGSVSPIAENLVSASRTEDISRVAESGRGRAVAPAKPLQPPRVAESEPTSKSDVAAPAIVASSAPETRRKMNRGESPGGNDDIVLGASLVVARDAPESDARQLVAAGSIDNADYYHTVAGKKRSEKGERVAESPSRSRRGADIGRDALDSDSSEFVAGTVVLGEPPVLGKAQAEAFKSGSRKSTAIPRKELANRLEPLEIVSVTQALREEIGGVEIDGLYAREEMLEEAVEDEEPAQLADMSELLDTWADEDRDAQEDQSGTAVEAFTLVDAAQQPFSTFGLDVDTAGYTRSKTLVDAGVRPAPDAVRQEEFINAFDYDDTAPDGNAAATFRVYLEGARSPFRASHNLLRVGIKGRRLGREEQRPLVLTILLDSSGSMDTPERMELARFAIEELTKKLSDRDTLTILTCSDAVRRVVTTQRGLENPETRRRVAESLRTVQCQGATNLEEGIDAAFRFAADTFAPGAENRVVVISDGIANLGSDTPDEILGRISAYRARGVRCSVIGVGRNTYNDKLLEAIANRGNGQYKFLDSREAVQTNFTDDLAASFNTIAADVKIQIEWNTNAVAAYRSHGYDSRALTKEQFRDDAVKAGEVGSGQGVSVVYEMKLRDGIVRDATLGTVHIRYRRTDTGEIEEIARPITADTVSRQFGTTRPQFRLACCVAESATILRTLPPAAQKDALRNVLVIAQGVALELDFYKPATEFAEMLQKLISMGL